MMAMLYDIKLYQIFRLIQLDAMAIQRLPPVAERSFRAPGGSEVHLPVTIAHPVDFRSLQA